MYRGLALVAVTGTVGACSIYLLSYLIGGAIAFRLFPDRVAKLRASLRSRRGYMLNYVVFMRVTYLLPNTAVNVLSPIVASPEAGGADAGPIDLRNQSNIPFSCGSGTGRPRLGSSPLSS